MDVKEVDSVRVLITGRWGILESRVHKERNKEGKGGGKGCHGVLHGVASADGVRVADPEALRHGDHTGVLQKDAV